MSQQAERPPFATPTLARLYLQQGHVDAARRMVAEMKARGEAGLEGLEEALAETGDPTETLLRSLLERIQERRRTL